MNAPSHEQVTIDHCRDLLWWLRGYIEANNDEDSVTDLGYQHVDALNTVLSDYYVRNKGGES